MDTYAADVAALVASLDLKGAVHIVHSTGGGEAAHYAARAKAGTIAKLILVGAVPPVMVKKASNPGGLPVEVFDGFRKALAEDRSQFYLDIASRSEEHTSELQSLMRISYAVFCLKKKKNKHTPINSNPTDT